MAWWVQLIGALGSAALADQSAGDATQAGIQASQDQLAFAEETRDLVRADSAPYREAGYNALNALNVLTGLPQVSTTPTQGQAGGYREDLYGDGNTPLTEEGVRQAYRDILGRDPDPEGLTHYLTSSPKRGGVESRLGPHSIADRHFGIDPFGLGGSDGVRGAYTYNEIAAAHRGSDEYQQKQEQGLLPPWESEGAGSANYSTTDYEWQQAYLDSPQESQGGQGAAPGTALTAAELVQQDPSYQFRFAEGQRALERSAAANGGLLSGGFGRALTRYGQDYASTEYANIYNRIANIAGLGQVGVSQGSQAALHAGAQGGQALENQGYYAASGYAARGNAWGNALEQIAEIDWSQLGGT